jgi:coproporphyrinogen III oxidase
MKEQFYSYIQNLQDQIVAGEAVDGQAKFREDLWDRRKVEGKNE